MVDAIRQYGNSGRVAGMTTILVPYHLDEHLSDHSFAMSADRVVTAELPPAVEGRRWTALVRLFDRTADEVAAVVRGGDRPTVLSGDCLTALGTVAGLQRAGVEPTVVWFDAHGDVQSPETSASGYPGGMVVRFLVGHRPDLIGEALGLRPVDEETVTLVDARDLDPPESEYLRSARIRRLAVADVTAERLPAGPLYLHLDVDVMDPADLPGLMFPVPGGEPVSIVMAALRRVVATGRVAAIGVACTWGAGDETAAEVLRPHLANL
jgi:arginase